MLRTTLTTLGTCHCHQTAAATILSMYRGKIDGEIEKSERSRECLNIFDYRRKKL
jgi:hypothetical protein